jgi:alpha-L-rhamnosidase
MTTEKRTIRNRLSACGCLFNVSRQSTSKSVILGLILGLGLQLTALAALSPERLRCEYLVDPLGIDTPQPRLSWVDESGGRDQTQTAYQILVASTEAQLKHNQGDLWDSGKVPSDESAQIVYTGRPLVSRQPGYWKVRVWDQAGRASDWSRPAHWEMGLLGPSDWQGKWIGSTTDTNYHAAPLLRRTFTLDGKVKQARAYICGLGYYELHVNGNRIGDHLLDPGYTRFDKRHLYVTYDVTAALRRGQNALGVILGTGWYDVHTRAVWDFHKAPWRSAPKLLMQLRIEYTDGRLETVATDADWLTSSGPIVFDSIYSGETYDARLEKTGWDTSAYDDRCWSNACVVEPPPGQLAAQMMPAIKADETIRPHKITEPKPGVFVVDMGQSFAGFAELKVRGPAGTKVVMKYGERLFEDGMIDRRDIQQHVVRLDPTQQYQTDTYILKGTGLETWHSRFDYHGFQYVEITGFPGKPTLDTLRGVFIHTAVPAAGQFECSNPLLNRIWRAAHYSYLSNLEGIPTDCPHREKNGWTGDAQLAAEQGLLNFDSASFYTKYVNDLGDEQQPSGKLPGIVPTSGWGYSWGNGPAWDSAFLLIPYYLYEYCGDARILQEHYQGLKRYVDYLTTRANNGIVNIGLNDWAPYKTKTAAPITDTAYYYRDTQIVALAARLSGNQADAQHYTEQAAQIRKAFNAKFYDPQTGLYDNGGQTALSCALYQGLVEPENRLRVLTNLVTAVAKANGHIDTGILGAKYILNALTEAGRADVAYQMASQKDLPSWGWWIEQGATTLWEQWNGTESRNHIMFGDISAWFYKGLAGINPDPVAPGFKHILIEPNPVGNLTSAHASYDSIRGRIVSDWKVIQGQFQLTATIPANTTATVSLPTPDPASIQEGGKAAQGVTCIRNVHTEAGRTLLEIGSGTYHFTCPAR